MRDLTIEEIAEILRKRFKEALEIGYNDTHGDHTDSGLAHVTMVELGLIEGVAPSRNL